MKKNIIFYIPSIEGGGVEKNLYLLIKYLPKQIGKIHIITANKINNNSKDINYVCPNSDYWSKKNRTFKNIICMYLLIKNFWSSKAVILSFQSNLTAIVISKILGFKVLIRLNTSLKKYFNNFFKITTFKFFYSLSDVIIVNSKFFQRELNEENLKSHLIYNLNNKEKKIRKLNFFKKFKGLKILNIGRLTSPPHPERYTSLQLLTIRALGTILIVPFSDPIVVEASRLLSSSLYLCKALFKFKY